MTTNLAIGQIVSGTYWKKRFDKNGYNVSSKGTKFQNGTIIGFTTNGSAIVCVTSGNLRFNVYRTKIDNADN